MAMSCLLQPSEAGGPFVICHRQVTPKPPLGAGGDNGGVLAYGCVAVRVGEHP
jgi:hypothetical protein